MDAILLLIGAAVLIGFVGVSVISVFEKEHTAAYRSFILSLIFSAPFFILAIADFRYTETASTILIGLTLFTVIILFIPLPSIKRNTDEIPKSKIDERDIMFSRQRLKEGSERFQKYYSDNPDKKTLDDIFRSKPGLLNLGSVKYDPVMFASADASFQTVEQYHNFVDGKIGDTTHELNDKEISNYIKEWTKHLGAVDAGITELKDYHLYSYVGRGNDYGKPVEINHKYAIAFTVEMDREMVGAGPEAPIVMESAKEYLEAGSIAIQIAAFIRNLGYPARAHVDGNYRVICPLVARDAGLGEIGRMGLLMTPTLGPRVRIAVVTTNLPLNIDLREPDHSVIDFCEKCKKCANVCPSHSIPLNGRKEIDGVQRWQINSESCFTYWSSVGTDCGRCMAVCPYSHPDNIFHNFIRWGVRNNFIFRALAVHLDDFFYKKHPKPSKIASWMKVRSATPK